MTRSNLYITLSNGQQIVCVADSTSAPEQGYIVEEVFTPLLNFNNSIKEMDFLKKHCTMDEKRANAMYRYYIDLKTKVVTMYEEHFNYTTEKFRKGKDITYRYTNYVANLNNQDNEESN
ncbi:penicillin-binding protein [Elizabethkingia miricola]|uniref:penicillin-binding protein n=1 Tax=Bacteroidota TaxID=976 RepID=UPI00099AA782|nr:penicillin-binding protein [Elizabethkingia miricola]OPC69937.1 penicillin-binding protein [Elizabethkingia miricola]